MRIDPDFIVVGAGTSGAVVATELADRGARVLLVERGGASPRFRAAGARMSGIRTEATNTGVKLLSGVGVGGTSELHGGIALRGFAEDYARWEHRAESHEWGTERCLADLDDYLVRRELVREFRDASDFGAFGQGFIEAGISSGYPAVERGFDSLHTLGVGVMPVLQTTGGRHASVASTLRAALTSTSALETWDHTEATRVVIRNGTALGVELSGPRGTTYVRGGAVVLCAGSPGSARLLRRSLPEAQAANLGRRAGVIRNHYSRWKVIDGLEESVMPPTNLFGLAAATYEDGLHLRVEAFAMAVRDRPALVLSATSYTSNSEIELGEDTDPPILRMRDSQALQRAMEIADGLLGETSLESLLGSGHRGRPWLKRVRSAHHLHGGAPMGSDPEGATVDADLRVIGTDRLWVADLSTVPTLFTNNTHLLALVIGYKAGKALVTEKA
ncbi:GMC family oxidoreductase N-terminal domain-containing protein [Nocardioides sp. SYSU D00038]|uniref:GMC family oxidoreductase N-terminal domain-containing protein n=1 Tax=Nocardioides sp. SYSU D00038 TaxID=2812554 RepID=UPI001967C9BA|nr:GMC family oxidoreductase [Nocardioides sp. SYSU D00038]